VCLFVVLVFFVSTPDIDPRPWGETVATTDYSLLGSSLLWLYTGWTSLGSLAGETKNNKVLLYGMSSALAIDVSVYLMALLAALTVAKQDEWEDGYFVTCFNRIVVGIGPYFGASIVLTALTLLVSAMICYSRSVWGMAEMGWAPRILARQLPTGAPHVSVFAHAFVGFCLMWFDFGFIVQVEYTVAATSYLLTYAAFLRLRYTEPDAPRPYVVPGGLPFAWALTVLKVIVMGATCVAGVVQDWRIAAAFAGCNIAVLVGYAGFRHVHPHEDNQALPIDHDGADDGGGGARRSTMNPDETQDGGNAAALHTPRTTRAVQDC
jgi:amino acid transporter